MRFTRNDPGSGLTDGETATAESVERSGVLFRLDDGKLVKLGNGDAQFRHINRTFDATLASEASRFTHRAAVRGRLFTQNRIAMVAALADDGCQRSGRVAKDLPNK